MELITKHGLITSVASRWQRAYCRSEWGPKVSRNDKVEKYHKLAALPVDASEQSVTDIIGNSGWTHIWCDECQKEVDVVVRLGEELDYESITADVCLLCLQGALELARGER